MFPVLARLGPVTIYTYTLLVDLGLAAGLAWLYFRAHGDETVRSARRLDAGLAAIVGGFASARLLYALVNSGYYFAHPGEIFEIWKGGLAWPGAAAGGLLGAWVYCRRARQPLAPFLDAAAFPVALLALLSWGGCLAGSCAYGREVTPDQWPAWLTLRAPDVYGLIAPRWPTQIAGLAWSLLALGAVWAAQRPNRWPAGALGLYTLSLVALGAFLLAFTRGDPMPFVSGYRLDAFGSALILLSSTIAWAILISRPTVKSQPLSPSP